MSREDIRQSIANKVGEGENFRHPLLRLVVGFMLGEIWITPSIVELKLSDDGEGVLANRAWEGDIEFSRNSLVYDLLYISEQYELTSKERAYLLSKIPSNKEDERDWNEYPDLDNPNQKSIRVTEVDGSEKFYDIGEKNELIKFCRRKGYSLHQWVKNEWKTILP